MSLHENIELAMRSFVESRSNCAVISPAAVAAAVLREYAPDIGEPHIEYASLEHFKLMARKVLARNFDDVGDENPAYEEQGELFSGHLQERYPVPHPRGSEPQYKLRCLLTADERKWNVARFRKTGAAFMAHADALEAEGESLAA